MTQEMNPEVNKAPDQGIEENFALLETLAAKLEDPNTSLEDSFRYYQQGMELLKQCSQKLDAVEKKMLKISENGEVSEFQG